MEQAQKPTEAPKPKSKTWIVAAVVIIVVIIGGVAAYILTRPPTVSGTAVSLWENPVGSCSNITPANCGYNPASLPITGGATVTWTNNGNQPHTVTACYSAASSLACPTPSSDSTPAFDSGATNFLDGGEQFSFRFDTAGTFNYYCRVHEWMHGTVTVS